MISALCCLHPVQLQDTAVIVDRIQYPVHRHPLPQPLSPSLDLPVPNMSYGEPQDHDVSQHTPAAAWTDASASCGSPSHLLTDPIFWPPCSCHTEYLQVSSECLLSSPHGCCVTGDFVTIGIAAEVWGFPPGCTAPLPTDMGRNARLCIFQ